MSKSRASSKSKSHASKSKSKSRLARTKKGQWIAFLKASKGSGMTISDMSEEYRKRNLNVSGGAGHCPTNSKLKGEALVDWYYDELDKAVRDGDSFLKRECREDAYRAKANLQLTEVYEDFHSGRMKSKEAYSIVDDLYQSGGISQRDRDDARYEFSSRRR